MSPAPVALVGKPREHPDDVQIRGAVEANDDLILAAYAGQKAGVGGGAPQLPLGVEFLVVHQQAVGQARHPGDALVDGKVVLDVFPLDVALNLAMLVEAPEQQVGHLLLGGAGIGVHHRQVHRGALASGLEGHRHLGPVGIVEGRRLQRRDHPVETLLAAYCRRLARAILRAERAGLLLQQIACG